MIIPLLFTRRQMVLYVHKKGVEKSGGDDEPAKILTENQLVIML